MAQIELKGVTKVFCVNGTYVTALKEISLAIEKGDIFGIIGMSGAGKSTLVRCLNYLEKPTQGEIYVEGEELGSLSSKQLRDRRSKIAMIFQHFNLLMQKNVLDNVAFPLMIRGEKKKAAREKAREYLKEVGLEEKEKAYPAQLSGGQKQRVAIARALVSNPHILLCDEATSALDPNTTKSILELLQEINCKYGITVVIITHQMEVIQKVCNKVAIIEQGELAEQGMMTEVFAHPKSHAGKRLIFSRTNVVENQEELLREEKCLRIVYSANSSYEPVIANMVLHIGKPVNILRANTRDVGGTAKGEMVLGVKEETCQAVKQYLSDRGLEIEEVGICGQMK